MADQRKILPVYDVEAPPPQRPLPLPPQRLLPSAPPMPYNSGFRQPPKGRNRCCRCLCWTIGVFFLLLIAIGITAAILYFTLRPKLPSYNIEYIQVSDLNITPDSNRISATFAARVTATNPNKRIGVYYEKGSNVDVYHPATSGKICEGSVPEFYQGHENVTVFELPFSGEREDGAVVMAAMAREVEENGVVLLNVRVKQPVRVEIGGRKLMKVKVLVKCRVYLVAENPMWIYNSSCKFIGLRL